MLKIEGQKITISYGDTISLSFSVPGYSFEVTDKITFAIRDGTDTDSNVIFTKTATGITGNIVSFSMSKEETKIEPGSYFWDISLTDSTGFHYTMIFPTMFKVKGVAHND